jgi:hypothetical protein
MQTATTPPAATILADPAALEAIFARLLTDPAICPRRLMDAASLLPNVERTATPGLFLVYSASDPSAAYSVQGGLCNCMDAQRRDTRRCKHALAALAFQLLERAEAEAGCPADAPDGDELDPDEEIPYALTAQAMAALDPTRECAACDDTAADHDGPEGQCTRNGVDAEGWWSCDCRGFATDDDAA